MVGDKLSDAESGWNAGVRSALVGPRPRELPPALPWYPTLLDFARQFERRPGEPDRA
jgi:hypothetical protein